MFRKDNSSTASIKGNVLSCTIKKPVDLNVTSGAIKQASICGPGVSVIDVTFPNFTCVDIGEITFKNNYAGFISIKMKCNEETNQESRWLTCLKPVQLMPDVHCDVASQDYFTVTRTEMVKLPDKITALRVILQQPSTVWASFGIDNLTIYEYNDEKTSIPPVVEWLEKHQRLMSDTSKSASKSSLPADEIAAGLQRLWALTTKVQGQQTETSLGRFDVDGSYEVNLLSYT